MRAHDRSRWFVPALAAAAWLGGAVQVDAQSAEPPRALQSVEVGTSFDTMFAFAPDMAGIWFGDIRTKVPLTDRFAVEGFVSIPRRAGRGVHGFYGAQIKQRLVGSSRGRTEIFATYGTFGYYNHQGAYEYRYETSRGPQVYRSPSRTEVLYPYSPIVGGGVQRQVAERLIVRFDAQGMWIPPYPIVGARLGIGVAVPLGRLTR